ncbi:MAG: thiamine-phosphate kinase [Woeseiaceae bacterium]
MDEFELIRHYFGRAHGHGAGVIVGIGDDGAILEPSPGRQLVNVIDTIVEGVHFPPGRSPADIAYRAVAINLSDIAAMGAVPRWMTLALSMPASSDEWLQAFSGGLFAAAEEFSVELVGGDTTRANELVVSVQITGEVDADSALRRDGATAGDTIYVTGTVGDAAAGLQGLRTGNSVKELIARFARPSARVEYGQALAGVASACIDVSDGLYADLSKLLAASELGAGIELAKLPISAALAENYSSEEQRNLALGGGDDYELCFTASRALPDPGMVRVTGIGTVTEAPGIVCRLDGDVVPFDDTGYRHFQ